MGSDDDLLLGVPEDMLRVLQAGSLYQNTAEYGRVQYMVSRADCVYGTNLLLVRAFTGQGNWQLAAKHMILMQGQDNSSVVTDVSNQSIDFVHSLVG